MFLRLFGITGQEQEGQSKCAQSLRLVACTWLGNFFRIETKIYWNWIVPKLLFLSLKLNKRVYAGLAGETDYEKVDISII